MVYFRRQNSQFKKNEQKFQSEKALKIYYAKMASLLVLKPLLYFLAFLYRAVLEVPTDDVLSEEQAWHYFRDMVLGIEYCKYSSKLATGYLQNALSFRDLMHQQLQNYFFQRHEYETLM